MWMHARWTRLGALLLLLVMSGGAFAVDLYPGLSQRQAD